MRIIDADAFRRELDNHWPFTKDEQSKHGMADVAKSVVLIVLNKMPTIEERKTGKWIHILTEADGNALYECSECHKGEVHVPIVEVKYCWNCGARMEGEG